MTCYSTGTEQGTFEELAAHWQHLIDECSEPTFFDSLTWQKAWWSEFGANSELKLLAVRSDSGDIKMIAPLMVTGSEVSFLGNTDLVDYHDFLSGDRSGPGSLEAVVRALGEMPGVESIKLQSIPGNSATITRFREFAEKFGWNVEIKQEDVAPRQATLRSWAMDQIGEADDGGYLEDIGGAVQVTAAVFDGLRFIAAKQNQSAPDVADVQRLEVLIEHQYW